MKTEDSSLKIEGRKPERYRLSRRGFTVCIRLEDIDSRAFFAVEGIEEPSRFFNAPCDEYPHTSEAEDNAASNGPAPPGKTQ